MGTIVPRKRKNGSQAYRAQIVRKMTVARDGGGQVQHLAATQKPFHAPVRRDVDDREVERSAAEIEYRDLHAHTVGWGSYADVTQM